LLFTGYIMKSKKRYRGHGMTMTAAVVLHLATIVAVMLPSLLSYLSSPGTLNFTDTIAVATVVHAALGITAASIGLWLVICWRMRADVVPCFQRKKFMLSTLAIWVIAVFAGIYLYIVYWTSLLT
jgi:hypothetical protein